jgi:integrase
MSVQASLVTIHGSPFLAPSMWAPPLRSGWRLFTKTRILPSVSRRIPRSAIALGHLDRDLAEQKADELSAAFRRQEEPAPKYLTLGKLFALYLAEVTPAKGRKKQQHDTRAAKLFQRDWGAGIRVDRLSRREWDRYIAKRRTGELAPARNVGGAKTERRPVRDRVIQYDLRLLNAVLNWAVQSKLIAQNPVKGLNAPAEESPTRTKLTSAQYEKMCEAARRHSPRLECFVILAWETGHRGNSIRQLQWGDVDLDAQRVRWRPDGDKIGYDHTTPLTDEAANALRDELARSPGIGQQWIFPAANDPRRAISPDVLHNLWRRMAAVAGLPEGERYGWHSMRRAFADSIKGAALRDQKDLGGWKTIKTLVDIYQAADETAQRDALKNRRPIEGARVAVAATVAGRITPQSDTSI